MSAWAIGVAVLAGFISFASPCVLPLVPAYLGNMVGVAPSGDPAWRRIAVRHALSFVAGFSIVFIALWASIGLLGYVLHGYAPLFREVGGTILIFFGLQVAGVISMPSLYRDIHLPGMRRLGAGTRGDGADTRSCWRSGLLGVTFAACWTPCIGPTLGGIIGLASASASVGQGTLLLAAYAVGLGIPFVLVALGVTSLSGRLAWFRRHHLLVERLTGAFVMAVGFLMLTNTFARLGGILPGWSI